MWVALGVLAGASLAAASAQETDVQARVELLAGKAQKVSGQGSVVLWLHAGDERDQRGA